MLQVHRSTGLGSGVKAVGLGRSFTFLTAPDLQLPCSCTRSPVTTFQNKSPSPDPCRTITLSRIGPLCHYKASGLDLSLNYLHRTQYELPPIRPPLLPPTNRLPGTVSLRTPPQKIPNRSTPAQNPNQQSPKSKSNSEAPEWTLELLPALPPFRVSPKRHFFSLQLFCGVVLWVYV